MTRPFVIGLTGSVGMGKSTTAGMFRECGVPVWDADQAVHALYRPECAGSRAISALYPEAVGPDGVDRAALSAWIDQDAGALSRIEEVIHPLVAANRQAFLDDATEPIVLLDIPLLFETGADRLADLTVVVSAPSEVQRARVLERPGMTEEKLDYILSRQMPDAEKRKRADRVIPTVNLDKTRAEVERLVSELRANHA
ncbi:dephospho-CoA kinase [Palleronia caenipelagi]|uniref:Dephospho-CoA kinase n=1 Tax=Palleronia caenipelagi TaxID=2489174 RepID=A0A547Q8S7_9RHOB|nr:dephospho-CoA kinase [Palleronia caenipelagi]TRD22789.1 dephospho-CoA kinase [Palleronia caenipelagi]